MNATGARRPYYLAVHLAAHGHRVTVLTTAPTGPPMWSPPLEGITVVYRPRSVTQRDLGWFQRFITKTHHRAPPGLWKRMLGFLGDMILPVHHHMRWDVTPDELEQLCGRSDVVLASGPAWAAVQTAADIAKAWNATFLVDQRDPWNTVIPGVSLRCLNWHGDGITGYFRSKRMLRLEERILDQAHGITAASPAYLQNALTISPHDHSLTVLNGMVSPVRTDRKPLKGRFTLFYAGRLYEEQAWQAVIQVFDDIHVHHPDIASELQLHVLGGISDTPAIGAALKACGARTGMIHVVPDVGRDTLAEVAGKANLLLSLICEGNTGQIPLKLVDYLSFGRPTLLFGETKGIQHEILERTCTGIMVKDAPDLKAFLINAVEKWQAGIDIPYDPDQEALREWSNEVQVRKWRQWIIDVDRSRRA